MSRIDCQLYAYDVLNQVQVTVRACIVEDFDVEASQWITLVSTRIESTGEQEVREWVQDVLVAALEAL